MLKSRFFKLFLHFSAKERRAFKKFVRSPFHNAREDARLMYEYVLEHHRKPALLDRKLIYEFCFQGEPYNDAKLRQVMTHLCSLMEKYLAVDTLLQNEIEVKLASAKVLKDRKLSEMAMQNLTKAEDILLQGSYKNRAYYESHYQILSIQHLILSVRKRDKQLDMNPLNEALEVSFIIEKLMRSCYMLSHQNVVKADYSLGLTAAIVKYVEEEGLLRVPTVRLYYAAYHALLPDAEEHWFYDIRDQLSVNGHLFSKEELGLLFLAPINYAVKKINQGFDEYIKEIFFLYKFGLEHNLFINNGEMSRIAYRNISTTSIKLGEYEWADQFIHHYKNNLATAYREDYYSYNLANLQYARQQYDEALQSLVMLDFDDLLFSLGAKMLLIKIYFETKEWDALDSLLSSFKTFLYRKKVMGYHKDNYQNIIDLTRKLITLSPYDKEEKRSVKKIIEETSPNTEKKWMLERLGYGQEE